MAKGIETYSALKRATRDMSCGRTLELHPDDAKDLSKLGICELRALGYDGKIGDEIDRALQSGEVAALGRYMGVMLVISTKAPRLTL